MIFVVGHVIQFPIVIGRRGGMKKIIGLCVVALIACQASSAAALEKTFEGTGAKVVTSIQGSLNVVEPYDRAINLHKLKEGEAAYWDPHSGKHIIAGDYAYLWCAVFKKNKLDPKHYWIAVTADAMHKALDLSHSFGGGVAIYKLSYDGKKIDFVAYPYSTLHALFEGKNIVDVKE